MSEYRIRRATPDDSAAVVALVSEMFQENITGRYDWLYRRNPHGEARSWLVHDAAGQAVAVTSLFPRRVSVGDRVELGSIGGDCYVLPVARRKGLATLLHTASLREMRDTGIQFMYGPPRPNNLAALVKAGSREVGGFRRYTRPLSAQALLGRKLPAAASRLADLPLRALRGVASLAERGISVEPATQFGEEWDELSRRGTWIAKVLPVRDAAFLAWRYEGRQQSVLAVRRRGELVGFSVYEAQGKVAAIVDAFAVDRAALDAALGAAIDRAQSEHRTQVDFLVTPAGLDVWLLARHGFLGRESRGFQVAIPDGEPQAQLLSDPRSWYFTEGDKDMPTCFSAEPE